MHYTAVIAREGKRFLIEFPDAPGCQTFSEKEGDVRAVAKEAIEGWLEAHLVGGQVPARPKNRRSRAPRGATLKPIQVDPQLAVAIELRWARQDAGMSQGELAKRAKVSQQQIAKLEQPGENPTIGTLRKIAEALGVELEVQMCKAS